MNAYDTRQAAGGLGPNHIDVPLSLPELIAHSALDPKARSGRPAMLSKEDKDRLVVFIKRDFNTRRMKMIDIRREAGFAHVSLTTLRRALAERGIGAYQEEFKPILTAENKEKRLVGKIIRPGERSARQHPQYWHITNLLINRNIVKNTSFGYQPDNGETMGLLMRWQ
jgi:hypothetical protein